MFGVLCGGASGADARRVWQNGAGGRRTGTGAGGHRSDCGSGGGDFTGRTRTGRNPGAGALAGGGGNFAVRREGIDADGWEDAFCGLRAAGGVRGAGYFFGGRCGDAGA